MLRLNFVEKIPALDTQKRVNKAIHPQSPIKYAREVKNFLPMAFQKIFTNGKTCAWNCLLAGEFMILIPSITVSCFAATHVCIFKSLTLLHYCWEWVQTSLGVLTEASMPVVFNSFCIATHWSKPLQSNDPHLNSDKPNVIQLCT